MNRREKQSMKRNGITNKQKQSGFNQKLSNNQRRRQEYASMERVENPELRAIRQERLKNVGTMTHKDITDYRFGTTIQEIQARLAVSGRDALKDADRIEANLLIAKLKEREILEKNSYGRHYR